MQRESRRHPVPSDVAAAALVYLGTMFVLGVLIPGGFGPSNTRSPVTFLVSETLDALLLVSIPLFFIRRVYSEPAVHFGFCVRAPGKGLAVGVGVGAGLTIVAFAYSQIIKWLGYSYDHPYLELFSDSTSPAMSTAVIFSLAGLLPVAEEIFFRGFIFTVLRRSASTSLAVLISATLFGLAHLSALSFAFNVVFGAVLAVLLHRSGSLLSPITAHISFNAIALALSAIEGPRVELLGG